MTVMADIEAVAASMQPGDFNRLERTFSLIEARIYLDAARKHERSIHSGPVQLAIAADLRARAHSAYAAFNMTPAEPL